MAVDLLEKKKAGSAFKTIGEVSAELNLPPHVLRFWESKFSEIKPHKRRGGHRYYRPADIEVIKEVKSLLYERGYTIKGAQKYLKEIKKEQSATPTTTNGSLNGTSADSTGNTDTPANTNNPNDTLNRILNELIEVRNLLNQSV